MRRKLIIVLLLLTIGIAVVKEYISNLSNVKHTNIELSYEEDKSSNIFNEEIIAGFGAKR